LFNCLGLIFVILYMKRMLSTEHAPKIVMRMHALKNIKHMLTRLLSMRLKALAKRMLIAQYAFKTIFAENISKVIGKGYQITG
jgi:hypothetical protein